MEAERPESLRSVLRVYFAARDSILSPDGILRIFSVISCIVCSVLQLHGGRCGGGALAAGGAGTALAAGGAGTALGAAFVLVALSALAACDLPQRAPLMWLYFELLVGTATGGTLAVSALLMFTMCDVHNRLDYLHGPFALLAAALALLSVVVVYRAVGRRWDRAQDVADAAPAPPAEQDV